MPIQSTSRQEHPPGAQNLASLKQNEEVFVVPASGEAVKSYVDFAEKQHAYSQPTWTDRYYGRSKLTYQQALALEKTAEEQLRAQVRAWASTEAWAAACLALSLISGSPALNVARPAAVPQAPGGAGGQADPPQCAAQG